MSLRDQLLAKGLVSKKDAQRAGRELKEERRHAQGSRKAKSELAREERQARAEEAVRTRAETVARRQEQEAKRIAAELPRRVRDLIRGNRVRPGKGQPFFHKGPDGRHLLRTEVSSGTAYRLRCGELALTWLERGTDDGEVVPIPRAAAEKLLELDPSRVLFLVTDTAGISDPDEAFAQRTWEPDLRPHRVR
ncbi:MAG: DUF2058 family protein [Alphaproteobacteria bacterium]|nr:DUF2058 family protein [Alphaproteobacteria bacterium]MCB9696491.1 DUF2058 family protein [Alphaproteobacteria bacterium]